MKRFSSVALCCLLLLSFALLPSATRANHAAGGEIIYEHVTGTQYRVFFKFYRDCTGPDAPTTQILCIRNSCNPAYDRDTQMLRWPGLIPPGVDNGSTVSIGCSNAKTRCDTTWAGALPGYREWWYYTIVDLPIQCNNWTFSTFIGNRNGSMNIPLLEYFYVETTFDNAFAQGNTSPYFSNKPIPYCCLNSPFTFNNGAVDPDGDSLSSEVIIPLTASACNATPQNCQTATLTPPISIPSNPFQTTNSFNINPTTGSIAFTPTQAGGQTITVRTKEYRNGTLIGYIMRDVQFQVITPCSVVVPQAPNISNNITGALVVNGQVQGCINQPLSFCYEVKSSDPDAVLVGSDNASASLQGNATTTYTGQKTNAFKGCLSWTPTVPGLYNLSVIAKDSTCRPPGLLIPYIYTIPIYIWPKTIASADTTVCPGDPVQLNVKGGGNFVWSYLSGPTGSLNMTTGANPIASPYATTEYKVTSTVNPWCGSGAEDTVKITVVEGVKFTPIDDIIACPNMPVQLDLKIEKEPGITYKVKWTPATSLNNPNSENPISNPTGDIKYNVVITTSNSTCKSFDTVKIDVLDGILLNTHDTAVCEGDRVVVNATGDSRYTYSWISDAPSYNVSDPLVPNPEITQLGVGTYSYTLTGKYPGCPDTSVTFDIEVQPIPTVALPDDATICYGDTMKIYSSVSPDDYKYSYSWTPGQSLDEPSSKDPIFFAQTTTTITLKAFSSAGCKDEEDITLTVLPSDFMTVSNDTSICPNDTVQLHMTGVGLKSFYWSTETNISDKLSADPVIWPDGSQVYYVYGRDTNLCYDTQSVRVTVKPAPIIDLPDSVRLYPGQSYELNPGGNLLYYTWFPRVGLSFSDISNPIATPEVNTRYFVKGYTEFGCAASDYIDILVSADSYIDLPNAFTPGSGKNNVLKIIKLGDATLKRFVIYNRWGQKVFETKDIFSGWDGRLNGEIQPIGVYVYTIEAITSGGKTIKKQGNITLLR